MDDERVEIISAGADTSVTVRFNHEGHTLGNALRWMVSKHPEVKFCGYDTSMDPMFMSLRVITVKEPALEVTHESMENLEKMCDVCLKALDEAVEEFP